MAYFERLDETRFRATEHTAGAWRTDEQHIAPAIGLLAHAVTRDLSARRGNDLLVGRLAYDILGVVPVAEVEVSVTVLRPGRTIELVEARLAHAGRDVVVLRAWLLRPGDTTAIAGTALAPIPTPYAMDPWDPTALWPGGFIRTVEVRRERDEPGRGRFWVRTETALVDGEDVAPVARAAGLLDIANGMVVRVHPDELHFPNLDLTAHLVRAPEGEWVGFDTTVTFAANGLGLTSTVLHDEQGPLGTLAQVLTLRPR
ncbi:thioesterase family protein [Oryzobacter telluris]|uniref:thioesterase family protein n=1 Tax=Oryzobacter telluris TaxID=3149179 RepID=UPI00370D156A